MNAQAVIKWLRQPTSVLGEAAIASAVAGYLNGGLTSQQLVVSLVGGLMAIVVPDNTHAASAAETLASDVLAAEQAFRPKVVPPTPANLASWALLGAIGGSLLAGCTAAQIAADVPGFATATDVVLAAVPSGLAYGQLACGVGQTVFAMVDKSGQPIQAKGATGQFVADVCAGINGTPVPPPPVPSAVPVVVVASVTPPPVPGASVLP